MRRLSPRRDLGAVSSQRQRVLHNLRRGLQVRLSVLWTCYLNFSGCILIYFCVFEILDCFFIVYMLCFSLPATTITSTSASSPAAPPERCTRVPDTSASCAGLRPLGQTEVRGLHSPKSLQVQIGGSLYCCHLALSKMANSYHSTVAVRFIVTWRHRHFPHSD